MKHISEIIPAALSIIGEPIESKHSELRALQVEREDAQAKFQMDKVRALDERIEDLMEVME